MDFSRRPLIIIAGPTAVGKTAVSVALAKEIDGEIVSADSVQVYRGLDIGSAKVTNEEMEGIPHHLIDVCDVTENYDVTRFQTMAEKAIEEIYQRGHIPILVGGTGFYIQALLYGIDFTEEPEAIHADVRAELEREAEMPEGAVRLYAELLSVDPASCERFIRIISVGSSGHFHFTGFIIARSLFIMKRSMHGEHDMTVCFSY